MTKREFLDTVFALAPNEANAIMDAFDEYVDSNEPHWIPVTENCDCDKMDKCEKLFTTQEVAVKQGEIRPGDEVDRYVDGRHDGRAMFLAEDNDSWRCLFWTGCGYTTLSYPKSQFKRTGRHYEIEPILEGIRNES